MNEVLSVGKVFAGTIDEITVNPGPYAIYVGIFTVLGTILQWMISSVDLGLMEYAGNLAEYQEILGIGATAAGLAVFIVAVVGQCWLWHRSLTDANLGDRRTPHRYLAFFGLVILMNVATLFGFLLLIVPGLVMLARWSMAPALLIGENQGVIEAMSNSWDAIKGNSTHIILAYIVAWFGFLIVGGGSAALMIGAASNTAAMMLALAVGQFLEHAATAITVALGIYLFRWAYGESTGVSDVFT